MQQALRLQTLLNRLETRMLTPDQTLDFDALLPTQHGAAGATRRGALKAALGVGYAAAALPALAQSSIKTSSKGLATGEASFDVNGFAVPAFYAKPAEGKNLPVVLVVSEIFGVHGAGCAGDG